MSGTLTYSFNCTSDPTLDVPNYIPIAGSNISTTVSSTYVGTLCSVSVIFSYTLANLTTSDGFTFNTGSV